MIRYIYTFFVGLFLAIFVGLGISVFYTEPVAPREPSILRAIGKEGPTAAQQRQLDVFDARQKRYEKNQQRYNRNVSAIVLACAVIILALALGFASQLGVVADGILLGGIFTLLYGIGRGMASDSNKYRFLVAAVGLIVTLVMGYFKFTRRKLRNNHPAAGGEAGGVLLKVGLWIIAVLVVAAAVFGIYAWQHHQVEDLNRQVSHLTSQLDSAKKAQSNAPSQNAQPQGPVSQPTFDYLSEKNVKIKVYSPASNGSATSPLAVVGEVPGNWSFEAGFPIKLVDGGRVIASTSAQVLGDWMTGKLVPFSAKLTYSRDVSGSGHLVLEKDNPSGLNTNDDSLSIPVSF